MKSTKSMLPWLWVFMLMNYLYCDVLSLFDASILKDILAGTASGGGVHMTPEMLLASAVLMQIPIAMILLSRLLPNRINRWANVLAAGFMALVQLGSLAVGTPAAYYLFFSVVEVGCLAAIVILAFRWTGLGSTLEAGAAA